MRYSRLFESKVERVGRSEFSRTGRYTASALADSARASVARAVCKAGKDKGEDEKQGKDEDEKRSEEK